MFLNLLDRLKPKLKALWVKYGRIINTDLLAVAETMLVRYHYQTRSDIDTFLYLSLIQILSSFCDQIITCNTSKPFTPSNSSASDNVKVVFQQIPTIQLSFKPKTAYILPFSDLLHFNEGLHHSISVKPDFSSVLCSQQSNR